MTISRITVAALAGACLMVGGALAQDYDDAPLLLPRDIVEAATAFQHYMTSAAAVGRFSDAGSVLQGLRASAAYEPAQFQQGMIAYGAIAALQDEDYIRGVQRAAPTAAARQALRERLINNPYDATQFDGVASAARRVEAALGGKAAPLASAGAQVKASAYTVQHQAWSKVMVSDASGRLAEVKRLSAMRAQPRAAELDATIDSLAGATPQPISDGPAGMTMIEAKALALAAEAILDGTHASDRPRLAPLLEDPRSAMCLRMAKLNLYQCMAVAGPQYEDIFCLGQHAMIDTGACVNEAVRGPAPTAMTMSSRISLPYAAAGAVGRPGRSLAAPLTTRRALRVAPED